MTRSGPLERHTLSSGRLNQTPDSYQRRRARNIYAFCKHYTPHSSYLILKAFIQHTCLRLADAVLPLITSLAGSTLSVFGCRPRSPCLRLTRYASAHNTLRHFYTLPATAGAHTTMLLPRHAHRADEPRGRLLNAGLPAR